MMKAQTTADPLGLVVPIALQALCVGEQDQQDAQGTSTFAGATTDFTNQARRHAAFLGANVVRSLADAPWQQLEQGIHIHWALPEAFTHGSQNEAGQLTFPAVCNHWLISRISIPPSGDPSRKSWVIESDALAADPPDGQRCITLPIKQLNQQSQNYQYVGKNTEFTASWSETMPQDHFKNLTGHELTAVSSGDITFAAFYPNCRNIFGFYDAIQDVTVPADSTGDVSSDRLVFQSCQ